MLTVGPTGASRCVVSGVTPIDGANGILSQPSAPVAVGSSNVAVSPACEVTVSLVFWGPLQIVGRRMKALCTLLPLCAPGSPQKVSFEYVKSGTLMSLI